MSRVRTGRIPKEAGLHGLFFLQLISGLGKDRGRCGVLLVKSSALSIITLGKEGG